jgi:tetratricopeptide (TPR) repeat protein
MASGETDAGAHRAAFEAGRTLDEAGRLSEAKQRFEAALELDPDHFESLHLLGGLCEQTGEADRAVDLMTRAIAIRPHVPSAYCVLAEALLALGRPADALPQSERAISLKPDFAEAHDNRGVALIGLGRPDEALASLDQAIALNPALAQVHANRGVACEALGRFDEAVASFDRAITLEPDLALARFNRGACLLRMGRFDQGWRDYEHRTGNRSARSFDAGRLWLGDRDLEGRRLFVHHEQGFGDTIQFSRYVALLRSSGAQVSFSVQDSLRPVIQSMLPGVEILGETEHPPALDYHCPLLSLPLAFGTTLDTIPPQSEPLRPDPARRQRFEWLLGPKTQPRIGISWSGNPGHSNDRNRSLAFEQYSEILSPDFQWVVLQNGMRREDAPAFSRCGQVRAFGPELRDFGDTAALLDLMDLVVSVDTSIAHLAGAMGKPVWVLLPFVPDWRWMLGRSDSPWHPSARLFRQPRMGDWASVIEMVKRELAAWTRPGPPAGAWTTSTRVTLRPIGGGFRRP